jgi:hypothetical protein
MWLFLGDNAGTFAPLLLAEGFGNHESRLGDLDDDGDLDILGKPYTWDTPRLDLWLNNGFWPPPPGCLFRPEPGRETTPRPRLAHNAYFSIIASCTS